MDNNLKLILSRKYQSAPRTLTDRVVTELKDTVTRKLKSGVPQQVANDNGVATPLIQAIVNYSTKNNKTFEKRIEFTEKKFSDAIRSLDNQYQSKFDEYNKQYTKIRRAFKDLGVDLDKISASGSIYSENLKKINRVNPVQGLKNKFDEKKNAMPLTSAIWDVGKFIVKEITENFGTIIEGILGYKAAKALIGGASRIATRGLIAGAGAVGGGGALALGAAGLAGYMIYNNYKNPNAIKENDEYNRLRAKQYKPLENKTEKKDVAKPIPDDFKADVDYKVASFSIDSTSDFIVRAKRKVSLKGDELILDFNKVTYKGSISAGIPGSGSGVGTGPGNRPSQNRGPRTSQNRGLAVGAGMMAPGLKKGDAIDQDPDLKAFEDSKGGPGGVPLPGGGSGGNSGYSGSNDSNDSTSPNSGPTIPPGTPGNQPSTKPQRAPLIDNSPASSYNNNQEAPGTSTPGQPKTRYKSSIEGWMFKSNLPGNPHVNQTQSGVTNVPAFTGSTGAGATSQPSLNASPQFRTKDNRLISPGQVNQSSGNNYRNEKGLFNGDIKNRQEVSRAVVSTLKAQGYSDNAIRGIMVNLESESSMKPWLLGDHGSSIGLMQARGAERAGLQNYINEKYPGAPITDPAIQAEYLGKRISGEIKVKGGNDYTKLNLQERLNKAKTPEEAAVAFVGGYERPSAPNLAARSAYYQQHGVPGIEHYTGKWDGSPPTQSPSAPEYSGPGGIKMGSAEFWNQGRAGSSDSSSGTAYNQSDTFKKVLAATTEPGSTMTRQGGPAVALGRMHPEYIKRASAAIDALNAAGFKGVGISSGFRPANFNTNSSGAKGGWSYRSMHGLGLAGDWQGFPGNSAAGMNSKQFDKMYQIMTASGFYNPYISKGKDGRYHGNAKEVNHWQILPNKTFPANHPIWNTVTPSGPKNNDPTAMWKASGVPIPGDTPAGSQAATPQPSLNAPPQFRTKDGRLISPEQRDNSAGGKKDGYLVAFAGLRSQIDRPAVARLAAAKGLTPIIFEHTEDKKALAFINQHQGTRYEVLGFSAGVNTADRVIGQVKRSGMTMPQNAIFAGQYKSGSLANSHGVPAQHFVDPSGGGLRNMPGVTYLPGHHMPSGDDPGTLSKAVDQIIGGMASAGDISTKGLLPKTDSLIGKYQGLQKVFDDVQNAQDKYSATPSIAGMTQGLSSLQNTLGLDRKISQAMDHQQAPAQAGVTDKILGLFGAKTDARKDLERQIGEQAQRIEDERAKKTEEDLKPKDMPRPEDQDKKEENTTTIAKTSGVTDVPKMVNDDVERPTHDPEKESASPGSDGYGRGSQAGADAIN